MGLSSTPLLKHFWKRTREIYGLNKGGGLNFFTDAKKANHKSYGKKEGLLSTTISSLENWNISGNYG